MAGGSSTKVVQITNIAPQATKDQMQALFGLLGKIEEIRLYPSIRDVSLPVPSRICYVKYTESSCVHIAQHMTNTVFIDRALMCIPVSAGVIPEEYRALEMLANGTIVPGLNKQQAESKLPPEVVSKVEGQMPNQVIKTYDPKLTENNLPEYPALPVNYDEKKVEETRRTILVLNDKPDWRLDDLMDFFKKAGEVKYACFAENDRNRIAMIEFVEQKSVIYALRMQGSYYLGSALNIYHSTQPIVKPEAKSNETAQKEIEEAMLIVEKCHNQISAVIDPAFGIVGPKAKSVSRRHSRSRSRSHSRRSKSRKSSRRSRSRKRSTSRSRRKRSTSRKKSRSRSRSRSKRRKRSVSRRKKSRSRSKEKKHRRRDRSRSKHKRSSHRSKSRERRTKSRERDRSHSRSHRAEKKKKSHREKRDERSKYSHSRSRSKSIVVHKSPIETKSGKSSRRRSVEKKLKRVSEEKIRDYDAEEKLGTIDDIEKSDNMDISDSP